MAYEVIRKSIRNRRSYRLSRFGLKCSIEGSTFTMTHYGTLILKADLDQKKILRYGGFSQTDRNYINYALSQIFGFERTGEATQYT